MRWYWSAAEGTGTPGSSDMILDETRSSDDGTILNDYVLLEKYKKGRFLQVTTTTGVMTIAEVLMTFAEMRKPPLNATHGMCDSLSYRNPSPLSRLLRHHAPLERLLRSEELRRGSAPARIVPTGHDGKQHEQRRALGAVRGRMDAHPRPRAAVLPGE